MGSMEDKPLTVKQAAFCKWLFTPGQEIFGKPIQAARKANYEGNDNTLSSIASENLTKPAIIAEKARIEAITSEKMEHDRDIAVKLLNTNIAALDAIILEQPMNVAAVTARTGAIRELNAISNLHSATVHTPDVAKPALTPAEDKALDAAARQLKLSLSKETA